MTIEQAKECLESIDILKYRNDDKNYFFDDVKGALDIAIKSLEAWDKVIEEIKNYCRNGCDYPYDMCESCKVDNISEIIEKYKKEIEE